MKFQGELLLFTGWFWQQFLLTGSVFVQFSAASLEELPAMSNVVHKRMSMQNVSISFFSCIAVALR